MKNKLAFILILAASMTACCSKKSIKETKVSIAKEEAIPVHVPSPADWREMECGLFMSPDGVIGFASNPVFANYTRDELSGYNHEVCRNNFLTTFGYSEDTLTLNAIIDTATFTQTESGFYKDKNHIYNYYAMCEGGYFNIFGSDPSSFRSIGGCYAAYQGKIYHERNGEMNADFKTFRTKREFGPVAKDKDGYFYFEARISEKKLYEVVADKNIADQLKSL